MNICMIAYTNYRSDARVKREAETLSAYSHEVVVICLKDRGKNHPSSYHLNEVEIREMNTAKYEGKNMLLYFFSYLVFFMRALVVCTWLTVRKKVDAVHIHNMPDILVMAAIFPRILGKKIILDVHDTMPETYAGKFDGSKNFLYKALSFQEYISVIFSHKVIAVNHIQKNVLISRGIPAEKIAILMNVPDNSIFGNSPRVKRTGNGNFELVYHGTLNKSLGVDLAIQAIACLKQRIPGIRFNVIGTGRDECELRALAVKLGVEKKVFFSGRAYPVEDLPSILEPMQVGIIPNRQNSATELMLPVKLLEYVVLGIPAAVPKLKTIMNYFSDDMVSYFHADDADSLATAIYNLYMNPVKRQDQGEKARGFLLKYNWNNQSKDLLNLYEKNSRETVHGEVECEYILQ